MAQAKDAIAQAFEQPVERMYRTFGEPVAAASIAQVHPAAIIEKSGPDSRVAVKVLRPGVKARFASDLRSMFFMAPDGRAVFAWRAPFAARGCG